MKHISNINNTLRHELCTGCGVCEDVCPTNSIRIELYKGEHRPVLDAQSCLGEKCGKCLKVCPGASVDLKSLSNEQFCEDNIQIDKYIGFYQSLYTGYSNTEEIRYHSASGGLLSQFLIFLLEKRIIDGAVVTGFSDRDHITPVSYIAKTKEEILKGRSSKYCPVALNKVGNEIKETDGKFIIVGLPCHIQGFRKRAEIDRKFKEHVLGYFAIYCSSNRTFNAQDYLLKKYHVDKKELVYFAYRDNGCLGNMVIKCRNGEFPSLTAKSGSECRETKSMISIPYTHYYGILRSFFKPRRCLSCIDHYGELADVCFGDIHIKPYSDDKIGVSSCVVRNTFFNNLLKQAKYEGFLTLDDVDANTLNESQKVMLYPKKRKVKALKALDRTMGRKTVSYDVAFDDVHPTLKDYVSVVTTNMQRFIGRHSSLWFIIDFLSNRNK